jgi:hypothetical protein
VPELIAACGSGETSPSTRLPEALLGRYRAGESIAELSRDYGIPIEQVVWGVELSALREVIFALPPKRRTIALCQAARMLRGLRSYRIVTRRRSWRVLFDSRQAPGVHE